MDSVTMHTFIFRMSQPSWTLRLAECVDQYVRLYGTVPTIAHVSTFAHGYPGQIGPVKISRGKGLFEFEMELGPIEERGAQQRELLSAAPDTEPQ